jgi:5-methylcytosine-specific restriction protein A
MSTRRRTLGIYASPTPKGPNGERLCRNCRKPLAKGQRHNCSPECTDAWMCKTTPEHLAYKLQQRDHGVCAICRVDCEALKKEWRDLSRTNWAASQEFRKKHQIPSGRNRWWDADHIIPVIEGGGECGLDNYRTLCIPCHKKVTAELRARIKQRRIQAKALPVLDGVQA